MPVEQVLFAPDAGLAESYDKQVLVPFSEYDPPAMGLVEPLLAPLLEGPGYSPGRDATVFRRGPAALSTPVCFEITYPALTREFRENGAELLLNLSNDAWFGRTGYADMHFHHALFRAVELRSWLVRGANTGISAVVDPAGRVVESLGVFAEGVITAEVRPSSRTTLYARFGDVPMLLFLALVLIGTYLGAGFRPRS